MKFTTALVFATASTAASAFCFPVSTKTTNPSSSQLNEHDRRPTMIGPDSMGGLPFYRAQQETRTPDQEWWHESNKFHWRGEVEHNGFFSAPQQYQTPVPHAERESFQQNAAIVRPASYGGSPQQGGQPVQNANWGHHQGGLHVQGDRNRGPFARTPTLVGPDTLGGRGSYGAGVHAVSSCPGSDEWFDVSNEFHWK